MRLNNKVSIYIPSTFNVDNVNMKMQEEETRKAIYFLSRLFGGCTTTQAKGGYCTNDGKIVTETICICYAYTTIIGLFRYKSQIKDYCRGLKDRMKQESISMEINNNLYFI